ncbi:MAG: N-acetylmuramoyl-L-alanine amidase [Acidobacteria bacterium]|nr:N-acetylmuramoyl-L-alanine amidase [Acidobacteriota bacterium]
MTGRLPLLAGALLLLAACGPRRNPLAEWLPSKNYDPRRPQIIVLHHTAEKSFERSLELLQTRNDGGPVSAHYLIGTDGRTAQLVSEDFQAWHAGSGAWGPFRDLNAISIGIELDNVGTEPFPEVQIQALLALLKDITARQYRIPPHLVLGHADVDPIRKVDPNPHFPWKRLAAEGFGLWPDETLEDPPPGFDPWLALRRIGYPLWDQAATLRAFHIHYRATEKGDLDDQDRRILFNLEKKVQQYHPPRSPQRKK